jgi:MFS family permease
LAAVGPIKIPLPFPNGGTLVATAAQAPGQRDAGLAQGLILSFVTFLPILATLSIAPAIPRLIQHFSDVPNATLIVPMLLSVPAICIAIASPFVGFLSDRIGRKRVLVWGLVIYGVFGIAPLFLDDLYSILATRAGVGIAEAMLVTVGKALIGDYFTGTRRQRWIGYQNAIDAALGTSMWLIGGLLAALGWRSPFLLYLVAIPLLVAVIFLIWEPEEVERSASEPVIESTPFPWRSMAIVYATILFTSAMYFSYPTNIARALSDLGVDTPAKIGLLTAIASIGTPLGALFFSRATSLSLATFLASGLACIGLSFVAIGFSSTYTFASTFGFFEQFGNGLIGAVLTAWCLTILPVEHRGRGMGLFGTFMVSGIFISPMLFAYFERSSGSIQDGFVIMGTVCAFGALLAPWVVRASLSRNT